MLAVDYFCGKTPSPMFDRVVNNVSGINICNYKDVFINICDGVFLAKIVTGFYPLFTEKHFNTNL